MPPKVTARQRKQYQDLTRTMTRTMLDLRYPEMLRGELPLAWHQIRAAPQPGRTRMTIRVDTDVAKFFRALGPDFGRTMNDVLRAFMLARLCEVLPEPVDVDLEEADARTRALMEQEAQLMRLLQDVRGERLGPAFE